MKSMTSVVIKVKCENRWKVLIRSAHVDFLRGVEHRRIMSLFNFVVVYMLCAFQGVMVCETLDLWYALVFLRCPER